MMDKNKADKIRETVQGWLRPWVVGTMTDRHFNEFTGFIDGLDLWEEYYTRGADHCVDNFLDYIYYFVLPANSGLNDQNDPRGW